MRKLCVGSPEKSHFPVVQGVDTPEDITTGRDMGELSVGLAGLVSTACAKRVTKEPGTAQKLPWKGRSKGTGGIESRKPEVTRVGTARATSLVAKKSVPAR